MSAKMSDFPVGRRVEEMTYDIHHAATVLRAGNVIAQVRPGDDLSVYDRYPIARAQMTGGRHTGIVVRWDGGDVDFLSDNAWLGNPLDGMYPAIRGGS